MDPKYKRTLKIVIFFSIIFYFCFILYIGAADVAAALYSFKWYYLLLVIPLVITANLIRSERMHQYLRMLEIDLPRKESYSVYFAGLSVTITPGKVGEVIKSYILKERYGAKMRTTLPVVFVERFTDLIGMLILVAISIISFNYGQSYFIFFSALIIILLILLLNKRFCLYIIEKLGKIHRISKYVEQLKGMYLSAHTLLRAFPLTLGVTLSFIAWGIECFCFYLITIGVGADLDLLSSVFIFSFSSIVGAASMLPGGVGTTETSIGALMVLKGVEISKSGAATLLIRASTLWLAVVLGLGFLQRVFVSEDVKKAKAAVRKKKAKKKTLK